MLKWGRTGLETLSKLAAEPGTGVRMASGKEVSRTRLEPHYWTELLPGLRMCEESELPDGFTSGWHYTVPAATMPVYLDYLRARFERAGGTSKSRRGRRWPSWPAWLPSWSTAPAFTPVTWCPTPRWCRCAARW